MKIFKLLGLVSILLYSLTFVCYAAEQVNLYTGKVQVNSQEASAREAAMQQAFVQVLIKLTGNNHVLQKVKLPTPAQVSQWVQQYRYDTQAASDPSAPPSIWLEAQFDQQAVNNFCKRNNIALWTGVRPTTLVWMAVEENGSQALVGEYELSLSHWQQLFTADSQARAVKVLFPLLDLTDKQQVELNDVWYHMTETLKQSATRYHADNVLSGRIYTNLQNGHWVGDWLLTLPSEEVSWRQENATKEELIKASVDRFANEMAQRSEKTSTVSQPSTIVLHIDNVRDMQSYLKVITYLKTFDSLENVVPLQMTPTSVSFQIKLMSALPAFEEQLAAGQLLQSTSPVSDNVLYYQYL